MIDTDMISSPNFARFVYDGDGSEPGNPTGPPGSGEVERVFADFWKSQGLSSEQIPFDGRSDYVGFTDRGIPAGGSSPAPRCPRRPSRRPSTEARPVSSSTRATTPRATDCRASWTR
ncbi:MAG: hypothetical protein ACJ76T_07595, partial [Solirubrobacteraceae bacterium]